MTVELLPDVSHTQLLNRRTDSWVAVFTETAELARAVANTDLVPEVYRGNVPAITAVMLYGREVGLPPMTAIRGVYIAKGKVMLYAEAMRGLVLAAGHEIVPRKADSSECVMAGRRKGTDEWYTVRYTMDDAKRMGLGGGREYARQPRVMLKARATAELCRDLFADCIGGFSAVEEAEDEELAAGQQKRTKISRTKAPTGGADNGSPPSVGTPDSTPQKVAPWAEVGEAQPGAVPLPGEPGYEDDPTNPGTAAPPVSPTPPVTDEADHLRPPAQHDPAVPGHVDSHPYTDGQRRMMHSLFNRLGVTDRDERLALSSVVVGRTLVTANDLSQTEAGTVIDTLVTADSSEDPQAVLNGLRQLGGLIINVPLPFDGEQ